MTTKTRNRFFYTTTASGLANNLYSRLVSIARSIKELPLTDAFTPEQSETILEIVVEALESVLSDFRDQLDEMRRKRESTPEQPENVNDLPF